MRSRISGVICVVAFRRTRFHELAQVHIAVEAPGRVEPRQVVALIGRRTIAVQQVELATLRDRERVVTRFGELAEHLAHLLGALQVELFGVEPQPLRVGLHLLLLDAQQHVVRLRVFLQGVVQVVGRHDRDVQRAAQLDLAAQDLVLVSDAVIHHLDEEVVGAEDVAVFPRDGGRLVFLTVQQRDRGLAGQAPRQADETLRVLGHQLLVHARAVVEALEVRIADQLEQVPVADLVLRQEGQVVVLLLALAGVAVESRTRGDVGLDAEDRLHAGFAAGLEERQGAEHGAVVGDRDRGHAQSLGFTEDRRCTWVGLRRNDACRTIEQRVLRMHVEVDEIACPPIGRGARHGTGGGVRHRRCSGLLRGGYPHP